MSETKYKIIKLPKDMHGYSNTLEIFSKYVSEEIEKGYKPIGGLAVDEHYYYQALVK